MATNNVKRVRMRNMIRHSNSRRVRQQRWELDERLAGYTTTLITSYGRTINTYLPVELMREIFLYSVESNQMKPRHLASVCRRWRSVITAMSHLWSTLRVGTWTEEDQVTTWLQRAWPKKVVIDTQRDNQRASNTLPLSALQDALAISDQWYELIVSSFPSENIARLLDFQFAMPMNDLRVLHVDAGCVHSLSFIQVLDLVPTQSPLSELRLYPSFASTYFLQPRWFPVFQNLTVLIVNGRDIHEPFDLLPAFTRLHTFEADHLPLPWYELDTKLPLLCTLRKLQLRASSVQWMAGRVFPCLEECAILLPRHWEAVQPYEVHLTSCRKLTYHCHPVTTVQYFRVPKMRTMELRSHDCSSMRVHRQLNHLCTVDGRISKLTTLRLTLQCSEQACIDMLKYLGLLRELFLSIAHPSPSWQKFLRSLAAEPLKDNWPNWKLLVHTDRQWEQWCFSQTWHANVLPRLRYMGIQCPKGFSQSECLEYCPLLRLVGWTRARLSPPLHNLKVWEGRGTTDDIMVDYVSTGYLEKYLGSTRKTYDSMIVRGMVTQYLVIPGSATLLLQLRSTVLFRQLQGLEVLCEGAHEISILPCLEQIKRLVIWDGIIPAYSPDTDLPLVHTLQWLKMSFSTFSWMLGRTFKAMRTFQVSGSRDNHENLSRHEGLRVGLPACETLGLRDISVDCLRFFSCPNVQSLEWRQALLPRTIDKRVPKSLHNFLYKCSRLQNLDLVLSQYSGLDSLIQFVFCDAREQEVWQDIRSAEVMVSFTSSAGNDFFSQTVEHRQHYEKWWKEVTVTIERSSTVVIVRASI